MSFCRSAFAIITCWLIQCWVNVAQRRRRWANIKPALDQFVVLAVCTTIGAPGKFLLYDNPATLTQCCFNVDSASQTLVQHSRNIHNIHMGQWEPWLKLGRELVPFNCYVFVWKLTAHLDPYPAKLIFLNFQPLEVVGRGLKLCLATATHNFKWLKITHICLILLQKFQILMFRHAFHSQ